MLKNPQRTAQEEKGPKLPHEIKAVIVTNAPLPPRKERDVFAMNGKEEYCAEVGDINCFCVPNHPLENLMDYIYTFCGWSVLNLEQILGGFTGE